MTNDVPDAIDEWELRVAADAEQIPRLRENPPQDDHYESRAADFRPGRRPSIEMPLVEQHARPDDVWLDIGAGGGRFAVPIAEQVRHVIALDPSAAMRTTMDAAMAETGVLNVDAREGRWPVDGWSEDVDVSLASHVLYDEANITAFLDAMERHTRRRCIVILSDRSRGANLNPLWELVHGEPRASLPAMPEFMAVLAARGVEPELETLAVSQGEPVPLDRACDTARRFLWLQPGTEKDQRMCALVEERYGVGDGLAQLPAGLGAIGVVNWAPSSTP